MPVSSVQGASASVVVRRRVAQRGPDRLGVVAADDLRAGLGRHRAQALQAGARGDGIGDGPQRVRLPERPRGDGVEGAQQVPAGGQAQQQRLVAGAVAGGGQQRDPRRERVIAREGLVAQARRVPPGEILIGTARGGGAGRRELGGLQQQRAMREVPIAAAVVEGPLRHR